MQSSSFSCQILVKPEFPRKILEKYSNLTKISPVGPSCSTLADRYVEANSRFSRFCESAGPITSKFIACCLTMHRYVQLYFTNSTMTHTVLLK
jgi:hypothetical protein